MTDLYLLSGQSTCVACSVTEFLTHEECLSWKILTNVNTEILDSNDFINHHSQIILMTYQTVSQLPLPEAIKNIHESYVGCPRLSEFGNAYIHH